MKKFYNFSVNFLFEIISIISSVLTLVVVITLFVCRVITVSGNSMLPTLADGDKIIITSAQNNYDYKDVVVIAQPGVLNEPIIKRVIATGGQWVDIDYDSGVVYVGSTPENMIPLDEKYIIEPISQHYFDDANEYPVSVPEGKLFVLGDNRNNSTDSRSYMVGFIDEEYVLGKTLNRIWSQANGFEFIDIN